MLGKKLIFTAHNVNAGERDENDTMINKLTLMFMYNIVDRIIVHTNRMKHQLINDFNVKERKISIIQMGITDIVPKTELTKTQARKKLNLANNDNVLLFFGYIAPYKGLEYLIFKM